MQSKGFSRVFSNTTVQKHLLRHSAFFMVQLSHPNMTTGNTITLTRCTFVGQVMTLLFNMLPRLAIDFLPSSKRVLISWLQSPSAVILEPKKLRINLSFFLQPEEPHLKCLPRAGNCIQWRHSVACTAAQLREKHQTDTVTRPGPGAAPVPRPAPRPPPPALGGHSSLTALTSSYAPDAET